MKKHIYWFAYYGERSPSVRYRAKYALEYAKNKYDISYSLVYPGYRMHQIWVYIKTFVKVLSRSQEDSLVVIQRVYTNRIYANLLKLLVSFCKNTCVYDLDDAEYLEHNDKTIQFFLKNCDVCTLGSQELANYVTQFNKNIIYQTSPCPDLGYRKQGRNKLFTVGWIGCYGGGHKTHLCEVLFPALVDLDFNIKLCLMGVFRENDKDELTEYFKKFAHITLEIPDDIDWMDEDMIQQMICSFDVGIASLIDDELHRSKSAFKLKQYMTCGIPVLSPELGENLFFVRDGVNGFFCKQPGDYKSAIDYLKTIDDREYESFSIAAQNKISSFGMDSYVKRLIHL